MLARFLEGRLGRAYMATGEKIGALTANMLTTGMLGKQVVFFAEDEGDKE